MPKLHIDTAVTSLGLNADRTLQVPDDPDVAGWWSGGTHPGRRGPAVIVGHRDSTTGPAVFYELGSLARGDRIDIERSDGSTAIFRVTRAEIHPKDEFPTDRVYGNTQGPSLRLITCIGNYDSKTGYRDNLIVFAEGH